MAAKTLASYAGPNFATTDPLDTKYGQKYLTLTGEEGIVSGNGSASSSSCSMKFCLPWEALNGFLQFALTTRIPVSGSPGTYVRSLPLQCPIQNWLYATSYSFASGAADANVTDSRLFEDCLVNLEFTTLPFGTEGGGAFLEINYGGSANYITVPSAVQSFSSGEPIDHDAGKLVGQLAISITSHWIPNPAAFIATANPLKGLVNSVALTIDGFTYAAGSILFVTYDLSKQVDALGNPTGTGTLSFIQRDLGWNWGLRSDGAPDSITPAPYGTGDLTPLLS